MYKLTANPQGKPLPFPLLIQIYSLLNKFINYLIIQAQKCSGFKIITVIFLERDADLRTSKATELTDGNN